MAAATSRSGVPGMSAVSTVRISHSLRARLEASREVSGRTLTGEVEARLRSSLRQTGGDGLVLLHIDRGLMSFLEAIEKTHFIGDLEQVAIFLIRSQIIDYMSSKTWAPMIIKNLPSPYREANEELIPVYRALSERGPR
jgi:hypothetical protein